MLKGRASKDPKSRSPSPREVCMDRHGRPSIQLPPMQPPPEHRTGDQLPSLSTLELPTHVTPKDLLQGQLKGADQDSKSRINSPREPDLDRHHRDRIGLTFMQPARKPQPGRQLPGINKLRLPPDTTSTSLGQLQGADPSGPPREQTKRTREEAPRQEASEPPHQLAYENREPATRFLSKNAAPPTHKPTSYNVQCGPAVNPNGQREMSRGQSKRNREEAQEAPEQPYQPAYENRKPAPRYPSIIAAPPKYKCASYEVPCGPASITPNRHRETSRGPTERNPHEVPPQEQQYRSSYESVQATKRHRTEHAAPPTHKSGVYDVRFGPTGITPNNHRNMSRGQSEQSSQKIVQQEVQERQDRPLYENVQATKRHRSERAAPPTHKTTGHYVPCGPANIPPDSRREMSSGQSERYGHEFLQQEAQEQQYQPFHQIREAARRYPSGPPTSQNHGSACSVVLIRPPDTNIHRDMSEADKKTCLEMRTKHPRVSYKKIEEAINHRHNEVEIERYLGQRKWFEAKLKKLQRERA